MAVKEKLQEYALITEIISAIAVVVSLLFVIYSINQNTGSLQASNDNFIYQLQDARLSDLNDNGELAAIMVKFSSGEELTREESLRHRIYMARGVNLWELAYVRYREGLMPVNQWETWDDMWSSSMPKDLPRESWLRLRPYYDDEFVEHVNSVYATQ